MSDEEEIRIIQHNKIKASRGVGIALVWCSIFWIALFLLIWQVSKL